jgi:2-oxo-4-hydroxy-4-carboxy-5-ureidoimidazoline decarboxylase
MLSLAGLNALSAEEADAAFRACCASSRWVTAMVAAPTFPNPASLLAQADVAWSATGPSDWAEAFAGHPRIGEPANATTAGEQHGAAQASASTRVLLAQGNAEYERRFGRVYIVYASGRSGEEILADLRARLDNPPEQELAIAAAEQHRITRLRLGKLIGDAETA